MALGNNSSAIYLSVSDGKFVRQFKTPTANSKERVTQTGKTVYEEHYDFVSGYITDIKVKEKEFGKYWHITLNDEGENYIIELGYSSGYSAALLNTLPNVDFRNTVRLSPKMTMDGDKKKSTMFVMQEGSAIKWYWTKDNPGSLPPLEQKKVKGKDVWDDSERMAFLEGYVNNVILPQIKQTQDIF